MATTTVSFGTGNTLLGLDSYVRTSPLAATRASFQALPTASYTGAASAASYVVTLQTGKIGPVGLTPSSVIYLTNTAGGTINTADGVTTQTTFGANTTVTFTTTSTTDLVNFLKGIYLGDTAPLSVSEQFKLTLTFNDSSGNSPGQLADYYDIACYLRGTGIATAEGEVAVEDLRIGDMLRTAGGGLRPVKFIGTQSFEAEFIAATPSQRPVLIRKDAIGEGLPARDLYVSAMHSLYIDEVMVPAVALVNGVSILRADAPEGVEYFHVELDRHDVLLAEGLPAESFIDDDSRAVFDNAFEYEALYGEGERIAPFAPRIEEGYVVEAMRRRFAARAGVELPAVTPVSTIGHVERLKDGELTGWVMNQDAPDAAVELEVLVDGEPAGRCIANRYRTDLDHAGLAGGRCGFTMALPVAATSLDQVRVRIAATGADLRKAVPVAAA
jgi:hypothetical protein